MAKKIRFLILLILTLVLSACSTQGNQSDAGLKISTSFYPVHSLTEYVTGDLNSVEMIQSAAGIHSFEPSAQDLATIEESDVFIYHSRTLESWAKNLSTTEDGPVVVEASEGIELSLVPGLEDVEIPEGLDEKSFYDPHSWLDPELLSQEAYNIADALSEVDPDNEEVYQANADQFKAEADELIEKYEDAFDDKENRAFITEHTAFQYLADRYDLEQYGIAGVDDSQEPSPQQMAAIVEYIRENNIQVVFKEESSSGRIAQTIADEAGVEVAVLDPLEADPQNGKNILENIEIILQTLDKYLE